MKEFTPELIEVKSDSALILNHRDLENYCAYIGLDVHKENIAIAVATRDIGAVSYRNEIPNRPKSIKKMVNKLVKEFCGELLLFSYEADPCGYDVYHQLITLGVDCEVVAPSLIPKKAGDRVKTDKRDAIGLARLSRSGELTAVWVPEPEQEAMRDLTRAREDIKAMELKGEFFDIYFSTLRYLDSCESEVSKRIACLHSKNKLVFFFTTYPFGRSRRPVSFAKELMDDCADTSTIHFNRSGFPSIGKISFVNEVRKIMVIF
ncbi:MAG: hypothetical protein COB83_01345 [Gammaproteobacteria bacterium]|nr:MAG: hypothetical protein COB83_01345 [Gammaproteobacteria bacterium]